MNNIENKASQNEIPEIDLPWSNLPSIFEHVKSNIDEDGRLQLNHLPCDEKTYKEGTPRLEHGFSDGMVFHFGEEDSNNKNVSKLVDLLINISETNSISTKVELYNYIQNITLGSIFVFIMDCLMEHDLKVDLYLYDFAKWLAFESPSTSSVKLGISLLAIIKDDDEDIEQELNRKLFTLGKYDDFTLYVGYAICFKFKYVERELWELSKLVSGWGRIHTIFYLEPTENPEIKNWILRKGFISGNMIPYHAFLCASIGNLKTELCKNNIDSELLLVAGELIEALVLGGPIDINDYEDGPEVFRLYINLMSNRAFKLQQLMILADIIDFLTGKAASSTHMSKELWPEKFRNELLNNIKLIFKDPKWIQIVKEKSVSTDEDDIWEAEVVSNILGLSK